MGVLSLDEAATRDAALRDQPAFSRHSREPVLIDEIQHAPDLLLEIKRTVDADTRPGRFLLTGSANILASTRIKDALTGRIETLNLWPLAQSEIRAGKVNLADALFAGAPPHLGGCTVGWRCFGPDSHRRGLPGSSPACWEPARALV